MRPTNRDMLRTLLIAAGLYACDGEGKGDKTTDDAAVGPRQDGEAEDAAAPTCEATDDDVGAVEASMEAHPGDTDATILPIVFVHGFVGSASQFDSQAQRFIANGSPPNKLLAFEHDGVGAGLPPNKFPDDLSVVIDEALAKFKTSQVLLIGHSRGTTVSNTYLSNPERAKKVSKVVLLDGRPCDPANGVPCDAPNQAALVGQKHVEVATSPESFKRQYKFLFGKDPSVVDITKEAARVQISGRAVNFPANTGRDGAVLKVYELDQATGKRLCEQEIASFEIGTSGDFGPLRVNPDRYYELTLSGAESDVTQHFYIQRFLRSTKFVRLLSGGPDAASRTNSNLGPAHAGLTVLRMREWTAADVLQIHESSDSGDVMVENVLNAGVAGTGGAIALYIQDDAATPKETTLVPLPYFKDQPFQGGADVYLPASDPTDGVITVTSLPRGDASKPQVLNFPNWPSDKHTIMVYFNDYAL
jgi:pimeloyl-ACP methyl ester carboxylesterase